jgi:hypothetical protein
MAARDVYHNTVRIALEKDNWKVTDDPLTLKIGRRAVMVDLGAEKLLAAEREKDKIAVEIKSFLNPSPINDLENALGQFILYAKILERQEPDRTLYLAINQPVFQEIFSEEVGQLLLETTDLRLMVFTAKTEEIIQWIP